MQILNEVIICKTINNHSIKNAEKLINFLERILILSEHFTIKMRNCDKFMQIANGEKQFALLYYK